MTINNLHQAEETLRETHPVPPKCEHVLMVTMTKPQTELYSYYLNNFCNPGLGKGLRDRFKLFNKIWSHPRCLKSNWDDKNAAAREALRCDWWSDIVGSAEELELSNKFLLIFQLLDECRRTNEKMVIFSSSMQALHELEHFLQKELRWEKDKQYFCMNGDVNDTNRHITCKRFNDPTQNQEARVFLLTKRIGSLALNLTAASRIVVLDISWNPVDDTQFVHMVYRSGQTRPTFVYRLVAAETMEEQIYWGNVTKESISGRALEDMQNRRRFGDKELSEIRFSGKNPVDVSKISDRMLRSVYDRCKNQISRVYEHEDLLRNNSSKELNNRENRLVQGDLEIASDPRSEDDPGQLNTASSPETTKSNTSTGLNVPQNTNHNISFLSEYTTYLASKEEIDKQEKRLQVKQKLATYQKRRRQIRKSCDPLHTITQCVPPSSNSNNILDLSLPHEPHFQSIATIPNNEVLHQQSSGCSDTACNNNVQSSFIINRTGTVALIKSKAQKSNSQYIINDNSRPVEPQMPMNTPIDKTSPEIIQTTQGQSSAQATASLPDAEHNYPKQSSTYRRHGSILPQLLSRPHPYEPNYRQTNRESRCMQQAAYTPQQNASFFTSGESLETRNRPMNGDPICMQQETYIPQQYPPSSISGVSLEAINRHINGDPRPMQQPTYIPQQNASVFTSGESLETRNRPMNGDPICMQQENYIPQQYPPSSISGVSLEALNRQMNGDPRLMQQPTYKPQQNASTSTTGAFAGFYSNSYWNTLYDSTRRDEHQLANPSPDSTAMTEVLKDIVNPSYESSENKAELISSAIIEIEDDCPADKIIELDSFTEMVRDENLDVRHKNDASKHGERILLEIRKSADSPRAAVRENVNEENDWCVSQYFPAQELSGKHKRKCNKSSHKIKMARSTNDVPKKSRNSVIIENTPKKVHAITWSPLTSDNKVIKNAETITRMQDLDKTDFTSKKGKNIILSSKTKDNEVSFDIKQNSRSQKDVRTVGNSSKDEKAWPNTVDKNKEVGDEESWPLHPKFIEGEMFRDLLKDAIKRDESYSSCNDNIVDQISNLMISQMISKKKPIDSGEAYDLIKKEHNMNFIKKMWRLYGETADETDEQTHPCRNSSPTKSTRKKDRLIDRHTLSKLCKYLSKWKSYKAMNKTKKMDHYKTEINNLMALQFFLSKTVIDLSMKKVSDADIDWLRKNYNYIETLENHRPENQEKKLLPLRIYKKKSVKDSKSAQISNSTPISDSTPVSNSTPVSKSKPISDSTPVSKSKPVSNSTPVSKSKTISDSKPVSKSKPVPNSTPVYNSTPVPNSTPVYDSAPVSRTKTASIATPDYETTRVPTTKPVSKTKPVFNSTPVCNSTPVYDSAPVSRTKTASIATPYYETTRVPTTKPVSKTKPVFNSTPVCNSTPVSDSAPVSRTKTASIATPYYETTRVPTTKPVSKTKPVFNSTPVCNSTPVYDSAPVSRTKPVSMASPDSIATPDYETTPVPKTKPLSNSPPVSNSTRLSKPKPVSTATTVYETTTDPSSTSNFNTAILATFPEITKELRVNLFRISMKSGVRRRGRPRRKSVPKKNNKKDKLPLGRVEDQSPSDAPLMPSHQSLSIQESFPSSVDLTDATPLVISDSEEELQEAIESLRRPL